ncbi:hypothetical protein EV121DRAFT_251622, partial [Schizophyllum commune]
AFRPGHGLSPHATFATLPRSRALMYSHIVHISSLSVSLTVALWRYLSGWLIGLVVRSFLVTFRYNYQLVGASLAGLGCRWGDGRCVDDSGHSWSTTNRSSLLPAETAYVQKLHSRTLVALARTLLCRTVYSRLLL